MRPSVQNWTKRMENSQALDFLAKEGWLSTLPSDLRSKFQSQLKIRQVAAGDYLYHAGDPPGGLVALAQGSLALEVVVGPRPPRSCFLLHNGTWLGEATTGDEQARLVGLKTTRPSVIAVLERSAFHGIASEAPETWRHLFALAMENHLRALRFADALLERDSQRRLAIVIQQLSGIHDSYGDRPAIIDMDQETLAAAANLSRSSISPILREMRNKDAIKVTRKSVRVISTQLLSEYVMK